jgi:hypothetical protein
MFSIAGGVGGVPESAVLHILTVEDPPASDLAHAAAPQVMPQVAPQVMPQVAPQVVPQAEQHAPPQAEVPPEGGKLSTRELEAYGHKKEELKSQLDLAVERYREVSSAQSPEEKATLQREITAWSKQLFDLRDEVKQKNQGRLPEGWENF